jgi:hypothetical protein
LLITDRERRSAMVERNTEITNKECLLSIRRPFSIGDIVVAANIKSEFLEALYRSVLVMESCEKHQLC